MVGIGSSRQEGEGVRDSQGPGYREPGGLSKGCECNSKCARKSLPSFEEGKHIMMRFKFLRIILATD